MTHLTLRAALPDDAPLVTDLIVTGFEEFRGHLDPPSGAHFETPEKVRHKIESGGAFIASVEGQAVGCVLYYPDSQGHLYLGRLAVLPAARQHGLGHRLVEAVETVAREQRYSHVSLVVRVTLPANRAYFESMGYHVAGYETHNGHTRPTMIKMLKTIA
ncbi:MAG: GNAT family N-acetyltransferase [Anaerolineae bacterium]|nr:GNAT family N-acetyltransferase [Anaerolineae bacterium]